MPYTTTVPPAVTVRPAQPTDVVSMHALLEAEELDRSAFVLDEFVIGEDAMGRFAGCARLKRYDDCAELSSVAVHPDYRGQRVGSCIIDTLLRHSAVPVIHLMCEPKEAFFFRRFGFVAVFQREIPIALEPKLHSYEAKVGAMIVMKREIG